MAFFSLFRDLNKGHIVVRTGDHDNKVADMFEEEFELEHLINHPKYDSKLELIRLFSKISMFDNHVVETN